MVEGVHPPWGSVFVNSLLSGKQRILHQRYDGHRSYSSRNRSDVRAFRSNFIEFHVACQFKARLLCCIGYTCSTYVNHYCTFFYHVGFHKVGLSHGCNNNICFTAFSYKILAPAVTNRNRSIARIAFCIISMAIGLPTMLLLPKITHFLP